MSCPFNDDCEGCDGSEGDCLKREGMRLAEEAQDRDDRRWRRRALHAIRRVALLRQYLDADDVRASGVPEPAHPNAWGSVWKAAIEKGWIVETQELPRRRSTRREAHGAKMTMYKSRIWEGF